MAIVVLVLNSAGLDDRIGAELLGVKGQFSELGIQKRPVTVSP